MFILWFASSYLEKQEILFFFFFFPSLVHISGGTVEVYKVHEMHKKVLLLRVYIKSSYYMTDIENLARLLLSSIWWIKTIGNVLIQFEWS